MTKSNNLNFGNNRLFLIQEYGNWIQQHIDDGWEGYLVTFMFNPIPGTTRAVIHQMQQEDGRLATRTVRKPRSRNWLPYLPKGIFVPDLPVCKRNKQAAVDVFINNGLHMHGLVIANRFGRIDEPLDYYFEENMTKFLTSKLHHIDVVNLTHSIPFAADYGMKGLKRPVFTGDDILIMPRAVSELAERNRSAVQESPIKAIQASYNFSDELAQEVAQSSGMARGE